jgi:hypothetical protein
MSPRRVLVILALIGVSIAAVLILSRAQRPVSGMATLDQCYWGWPVVVFEGEDWKDALPAELRAYPPGEVPIAEWPDGMQFDEATGELRDANGVALFHTGDRLQIRGTVIGVHGDPSPCFFTLGVKVEEIASP